jgi:DNA-binding transcriptional LysR family regulator
VATRRAHLGIIAHLESPQSVLAFSRYGHDRLVVASSAASDAIRRDGIGFRDCLEMPIITLAPAAALTRLLTHHAESLGRQLDVRTNVQTFSEILHLVSAGVGVAILPLPIAARASLSSVRLTELLEPWATRTLRICTPQDQGRVNQLALQFLSLVVTPSDLLAGWRHSSGRDSVEGNPPKVDS